MSWSARVSTTIEDSADALAKVNSGAGEADFPEAQDQAEHAGTLPEQETVSGTLADLAGLAAGLESPALVVVGDVVAVGAGIAAAARTAVAAHV
ncbi:MAG: hypothetical protein WCJ67_01610 [Thermoleophilia bacterium]